MAKKRKRKKEIRKTMRSPKKEHMQREEDYHDEEYIEEKLIFLAERTGIAEETILEGMVDAFNDIYEGLRNGAIISFTYTNGSIKSYTLDSPREIAYIPENSLLELVTDKKSSKYLRIANPQHYPNGENILTFAGGREPLKRTLKFKGSQIESFLRKPMAVEIDPRHLFRDISYRRFLKRYGELGGDPKLLEHDYKILFGEKLPKPNYRFVAVQDEK